VTNDQRVRSDLPPSPDFAAVEAAAPAYADRQTRILGLIGNLILSWSNNESMFVYVLMILLRVDDVSAALVFTSLNTTRARLDLVRRLASLKIRDEAVASSLSRLLRRFDACTKVRNEFNHCVYNLDERGEIVTTHIMRIQEGQGRLSLGSTRAMDESRVRELRDVIRQLKRINRDLWALLPVLEAHVAAAAETRAPAQDGPGVSNQP
jgi:hypothetical protein